VLQRVWIEPGYRRQRLLTDSWKIWRERYGDTFPIDDQHLPGPCGRPALP
jgi:hypothetical protein